MNPKKQFTFVPYSGFTQHYREVAWDYSWKWNFAISLTLLNVDLTKTHSKTDYPNLDFNNYIYKKNLGNVTTIAETTTTYDISNTNYYVVDADICINSYYVFSTASSHSLTDFPTTILHEFGHVMGLGHSQYASAVMYATISKGDIKRTLTSDDINGVRYKYN